ncbi:Maf family protein [Fictibacillus iocasae]|uniref:dTTP/UTP pyrophosphatase n=1 Tax=Fictibacillus iocasae TaxID=2715437 RepID=A0ABW2NQ53_9BACL
MKRLILASSSPRRKELLSYALLPFDCIPSQIEEVMDPGLSAEELVCSLAEQKAQEIFIRHSEYVIIGSDTIVVLDGIPLGKPKNEEEAYHMLSSLSGRTHDVYTGVCLMDKQKSVRFAEKTEVRFWPLSEDEMAGYIASKEPFDKAGGYGIQGRGAVFIHSIIGDYYNVMGLPVSRVVRELEGFGIFRHHGQS